MTCCPALIRGGKKTNKNYNVSMQVRKILWSSEAERSDSMQNNTWLIHWKVLKMNFAKRKRFKCDPNSQLPPIFSIFSPTLTVFVTLLYNFFHLFLLYHHITHSLGTDVWRALKGGVGVGWGAAPRGHFKYSRSLFYKARAAARGLFYKKCAVL